MRAIFQIAVIGACVLPLTGCTGLWNKVNADAHADAVHAGEQLSNLSQGDNHERDVDDVVVRDDLWLSGNTLKLSAKAKLPSLFSEPASFDGSVDSLHAFAERITRLTRVPVKVAPGAEEAASQAMQAGAQSGAAALPPGLPPLPAGLLQGPSPQATAAGARRAAAADAAPVHIVYPHGSLQGLLDVAAARFGVYWKYANGAITLFYTDTRVYQVSAIPGDSKVDTSVASGSSNSGAAAGGALASGGGLGGGSGSGGAPTVSSENMTNIAMNAQLSVYNGLQSAIRSMLSPVGAVISSPATGSISVTDTPDVLERVGEFIDQQNRVLSRQVLVNVTVLSVTLTAGDTFGINWAAVYQALGTKFNITNTFPTGLQSIVNQFSATVITPSSRASATQAMINVLSEQGTVRRKTSASVTTLNDQPVPVQVAEQQSYLAQVSTFTTANVGSQVSLTPGTVTTGFNLTLLPHILDDGTVMMQFYTNISSLAALASFGPPDQQIQLPTVDTRNFLQRVAMKSGQTLVISGYEGVADQNNQQGVGQPSNYLLGGGQSATHSREIIVILISPISMNGA
jgi:type IVB pilus formation R64 PilN family outer membrane protein